MPFVKQPATLNCQSRLSIIIDKRLNGIVEQGYVLSYRKSYEQFSKGKEVDWEDIVVEQSSRLISIRRGIFIVKAGVLTFAVLFLLVCVAGSTFGVAYNWGRRITLGDEHPDTLESWNNLIEFYEAWNKPEKAEQWRTKLPQK